MSRCYHGIYLWFHLSIDIPLDVFNIGYSDREYVTSIDNLCVDVLDFAFHRRLHQRIISVLSKH